ncbi:MAG: DUF4153 domain-containing protein [Nocardioidaceae bacterium]
MTTPAVPVPGAAPTTSRPMLDSVFGDLWPEHSLPGRPRLLTAAVAVGVLAALVLPFRAPGVGAFAVLLAACGVVAFADGRLRTPYHLASAALCALLLGTVAVRDAVWVVALCWLAAFAVGAAALAGGRSVGGLAASLAAVPMAGLRGLPWLGRSLAPGRPDRHTWVPWVRTALVSVLAVLVFGALFASADAVFARWAGALVPDLSAATLVARTFFFLAIGGLTLAGVYVGLNPPRVERLALPAGVPVARSFEWLVPVTLVVALFVAFVAAQAAAMFGGHAYLRRTTGLTYADYVHQGFAQLTVATVLTLGVVAAAARKAPRASVRDRLLLRAVLGALCALTLVVVASALYRLHVYEQAYGFTRLRLLVAFFEGWLGVVVLLVAGAGLRLRGWWVPRAVLLSGAAALVVLAGLNPDGFVAARNVQRYEQTHEADWGYLSGLSADAAPALAALPADVRGCVSTERPPADDWLSWNLGRARARSLPQPSGGTGSTATASTSTICSA